MAIRLVRLGTPRGVDIGMRNRRAFLTTALGGLLGYYRGVYAIEMLNSGHKSSRVIGHILWPETMFGFFENFVVVPAVGEKDGKFSGGIQFSLKF